MNEEIKIEKNVPIPKGCKNGLTEALKKMKAGDSFESPSWVPNVYTLANRIGIKIIVLKQDSGSYRIWRKA